MGKCFLYGKGNASKDNMKKLMFSGFVNGYIDREIIFSVFVGLHRTLNLHCYIVVVLFMNYILFLIGIVRQFVIIISLL